MFLKLKSLHLEGESLGQVLHVRAKQVFLNYRRLFDYGKNCILMKIDGSVWPLNSVTPVNNECLMGKSYKQRAASTHYLAYDREDLYYVDLNYGEAGLFKYGSSMCSSKREIFIEKKLLTDGKVIVRAHFLEGMLYH